MTVPSLSDANPFVGRAAELTFLTERLDAAVAGRGTIVLLAGEPGIGKTRLAEEVATIARERGARALWGRCYEGEGAPAFWPWVEVVRAWLRGRDAEAVRTALGAGVADIAQLVPELYELLPDLAEPSALESAQARFRLFDSVAMFLTRAAGPGGARDHASLLVLLDDLHWADEPSLLLLEFLARDMADRHLLVIGTYRDVEVRRGHPLARTLGELARRPHVTRLTLAGLGPPDVARVVAETTGTTPPADLVAALAGETDGNPLYLTELARLLAAQGRLSASSAFRVPRSESPPRNLERGTRNAELIGVPPTVRDVIGRRLDRLSVECNRILTVAAVIGREFGLEVLGKAAESAGGPLLAVLEEAEAAQIIAAADGGAGRYRFSHVLIRETLYEDLPSARRPSLHRQVGAALEAARGSDAERYLTELAWHFSQAAPVGEAEQAVTYAERAAGRAMRLYAYEEAIRHYEVALRSLAFFPGPAEERRCDLLLALGKAYAAVSEGARARETYREAAAAARRLGASGGHLLARSALGFCEVWAIEVGAGGREQVSLMEEAIEALGTADSPLRAMLLGHLASRLAFTARRDRAPALLREAEAVARRSGDAVALASVLGDRHWVLWAEEDATDRLAAAREIVRLGGQGGNPEMTLLGHDLCIVDLIEQGEVAAADAELATCARLAGELRAPFWLWRLGVVKTMRALLEGRFVEAERLGGEARAIGERVGLPEARSSHRGQEVLLRYEQGRLGDLAEEHAAYAAGLPTISVEHCVLALIYAETDRPQDARRELDRLAASDFAAIPHDVHWLPAIICLSRVCATLGDPRHAATLYRLLSPHAHRIAVAGGGNVCFGAVSHDLGILAATTGHWDAAARHFDDALVRNLRLGARPLLARVRHAYAAMLVARDHPDDRARARDLLDQVLVTARELGMARLEAQALFLWERLDRNAPPTIRTAPFPAGLSAREVEVLALVAAGRTNREIAAALVLSVSTVQNHLVTIYRKIDARNRADATAFALRHGIAHPPTQ